MEATPPGSPALQANSLPAEPLGQHTSLSKVPLSALSTSTSRGMLPKWSLFMAYKVGMVVSGLHLKPNHPSLWVCCVCVSLRVIKSPLHLVSAALPVIVVLWRQHTDWTCRQCGRGGGGRAGWHPALLGTSQVTWTGCLALFYKWER